MSRSYYRHPSVHDSSSAHIKWAQRQAEKRVRHTKGLSNGKGYKKVYCAYDIRDYRWTLYTEQQVLNCAYHIRDYPIKGLVNGGYNRSTIRKQYSEYFS